MSLITQRGLTKTQAVASTGASLATPLSSSPAVSRVSDVFPPQQALYFAILNYMGFIIDIIDYVNVYIVYNIYGFVLAVFP